MSSFLRIKDKLFYGWVVLASIIPFSVISMGVNTSFGVFFKSFESTFHLSRATTSAILSGRTVLSCVFAFIGGWAIDRYGPKIVFSVMGFFIGLSLILTAQTSAAWQLFITYSLFLAIGIGAAYPVMTSTILRWFDRRRGLALGIAGSGGGLGTAFVAPFTAYLIDCFEWRNTLMILGVIAWLVILPAAQLMKKDPGEIDDLPDGALPEYQTSELPQDTTPLQKISLLQIVQTKNFWSFLFIWLLMASCSYFVITHIVPHAIDLGFSAIESATILSLSGASMIAGRFISGIITDRFSVKGVAIICSLLQGTVFLWLVWAQKLWMLYLFGLVHGFTWGGFGTAITVLIGRSFGLYDIGKILGTLEIGIFVGATVAPFLGGLIFDLSNSYSLAFLIMAGTILIRILLVIRIKR